MRKSNKVSKMVFALVCVLYSFMNMLVVVYFVSPVMAAFRLTPLQFAELCFNASAAEVQNALNAGADMNQDALVSAASHNPDPQVITVLVNEGKKYGLDIVNMRSSLVGTTALYEAAGSNNIEVIQALINAGADANMEVKGMTPFDNATSQYSKNARNPYIADLLAEQMKMDPNRQNRFALYLYKKESWPLALKWWRKAADGGNVESQCNVGYMYMAGLGVSKNAVEGVKWYRKAAENGFARAQFDLGCCYSNGIGLEKDYQQAVEWYRKAADQGHVDAQKNLADMYYDGNGVEQNYTEAFNLYSKAADSRKNTNARKRLASMYEEGKGVKQDYKQAIKCYEAVGSADDNTQINIERVCGKITEYLETLSDGDTISGLIGEYYDLIHHFKKGAERGNAACQCLYGLELLWEFRDFPINNYIGKSRIQESLSWIEKAANNGNGLARKIVNGKAQIVPTSSQGNSSENFQTNGIIIGDKVNIRTKPNTSSKVVKQLNTGHPVKIIEQRGDWSLIQTASGTKGWVFYKYIKVK